MKAVILAGGEGTRLRPLSCDTPKPMTRLFDRPIMEHTINLLKKHGIREIAVTLCYMPHVFEEYFADGSDFGVRLRYYYENEPLGTAGCVAACRDFLDEEFIVISGDAVCDFHLDSICDFHREKNAQITVVLSRQSNPLGYGLVLTDEKNVVRQFIEKPDWENVLTDHANTGIYILSPSVLEEIPVNTKYDFAQDLFPKLLAANQPIHAMVSEGYWCDVGNCGAYLACVRDALAGRVSLELPAAAHGIRALSEIPRDTLLSAPVYIGENVTIAPGAHIGPYTVLGAGTHVGSGSTVSGSVVNSGYIGRNAKVRDSIVCHGASIGSGAVLHEGCVVGQQAEIGTNTILRPGVLVWPGKSCADGADVHFNITSHVEHYPPRFGENATLCGEPNGMLTPEFCTALGLAAAMSCGNMPRIGIGCENEPGCGMLASALECGLRAGGAKVIRCGGSFAAAAAYGAQYASFDLCFFLNANENQTIVHIFDADGLPPRRDILRRIENTLCLGDFIRVSQEKTGQVMKLSGLMDAYCRSATSYGDARGRTYAVSMNRAGPALCNTLWLMGARVAACKEGRATFQASPDGLQLQITDESGQTLKNDHTMACAAYAAFSSGEDVAVPFSAPAAFDTLAGKFGKQVYRVGQDGKDARTLWAAQPFMRDAIHRSAYLAAYTAKKGISIVELASRVPEFYREYREIPLTSSRAQFMREVSASFASARPEYGQGLRVPMDGGWVYIAPSPRNCAIRIYAESSAAEMAQELCDGISERVRQLDNSIKRRKSE